MTALGAPLGLLAAAAGVGLLRAAWARRGSAPRLLAGWALLVAGAGGWRIAGAGWDKVVALAVLAPGLVALAVLVAGAEWPNGDARRRRPAADVQPPATSGAAWRSWVRAACVGPLALAAALGCAALAALRLPGEPVDRFVAGGLLMPAAWAVGGVWATTDDRLGRVAAGLSAVAIVTFGVARL